MNVGSRYSSGIHDASFYDLAKHDISEIESKGGVAKLATLSDLRNSGDKLIKTDDVVNLMERFDSESFATYSKIGKSKDGEYTKEQIQFLDKWINGVKSGYINEANVSSNQWKKYDISDNKNRVMLAKVDTLSDLRNAKETSFLSEDIAKLMKKHDPEAYKTYQKIAIAPDGNVNPGGIQFLNKWVNAVKNGFIKENDAESAVKTNDISTKNEEKLSQKAQDFLKNLRAKYGNYDFMVGNGSDELRTLSKSGSKEFSVIFSNAELEKMANDEKYAAEKMYAVENSVNMCRKIYEEKGYGSPFGGKGENGSINKIGIIADDNGNMKFFVELEKSSGKQKERIEKAREKKAEEKKTAEKKAHKKNPYEKDTKDSVKRTTIEANSFNELLDKLEKVDWSNINDSKSGDRFNFSV